MNIAIDLQNESSFADIPNTKQIARWLHVTIKCLPSKKPVQSTITIRLIDKNESALLNQTYRHKKGPTNILSFADENIPGFESESFGDLAICIPLVMEEAQAQQKAFMTHFTHLVIHGFLHLLGYDHEEKTDAQIMENLEIEILQQLGLPNPYQAPY